MRSEPKHTSELVSQLLFGETFEVIEKIGDWIQVRANHDHYIGWVNSNQVSMIAEATFEDLGKKSPVVCGRNFASVKSVFDNSIQTISAGSSLPGLDDDHFAIGSHRYKYSDEFVENTIVSNELLTQYAMKFLNVPYLWGGRSCFGIDCSGLMQVVFKMAGLNIPRDASVQATQGKSIDLLVEAQPGDLLFFDDEEQKITHVGMLIEGDQIIHAFGKVRIDPVDHHGIFNKDLKRYTHNLRLIKRMW
jgi:cell wall-associated NlpC family hydrolase